MSDAQWYYFRGGEQFGPVSIAVLRDMASSGTLGPSDLVWRQGSPDWSPVREVPELAEGASVPVMRDPDRSRVKPHGSGGKYRARHANRLWIAIGGCGLGLGLLALATFSRSIVPKKPEDPMAAARKGMEEGMKVLGEMEEKMEDVERKTGFKVKIPGRR